MNEWIKLLFSLTLSGSMIFAAAVLVRYALIRWVPKWFLCCLWLFVLISFLFPLGSRYSLLSDWKAKQETAVPAEGYSLHMTEKVIDITEQNEPELISQAGPKGYGSQGFLFPLWLCGSMIVLSWKLIGYHRFRRRMLSHTRPSEEWEESMLRRLAGDEKVPQLFHSTEAKGPVLMGMWRCILFLPDMTYSPEVLEDVLAHELSHWKRHDLALKWLAALVHCVHWFNPVCWWLPEQIDRDCELACDERVIKNQNPERCRRYGRTLVLVAASQGSVQSLAAPMYSQKQRLKERLDLIMNNKKSGNHITIVLCIAVLLMGLSTMLLGVYAGNFDTEEMSIDLMPLEADAEDIPIPQDMPTPQDIPEQPTPEEPVTPSEEQGQLLLPLEPVNIMISAHFGSRINPVTGETVTHNGVDFKADSGINVLAADNGVVITSAFESPYGEYVVISHDGGRTTLYANMLTDSRTVAEGDTVAAGQVIGQVGSTGLSTGPHLHFELWQDGAAVNPLDFLPIEQ